jgi:hypothetical protein
MARSPLAAVHETDLASDQAAEATYETAQSSKRTLGPKVVYIQLAPGADKGAILSVHTNTRTLVDSMEQNAGSSYVKMTLPQGEPRGPKKG